MIATGQNPSISVGPAPTQPGPVPDYLDKWVLRTYRKEYSVPKLATVGAYTSCTAPNELNGAFLEKVQVWGVGTQSLYLALQQGVVSDLGQDEILASDYSSLAQLPGVTFMVPPGHATGILTGDNICKIFQLVDTAFKVIVHYHAWVRV